MLRAGKAQVLVAQLRTQHRVVEQHAHFGIEVGRTRVEVERTDETTTVIDHECLGVQAGPAAAEQAGIQLAVCLQFVQLHAGLQQRHAVAHVAAVYRRHVVGGERIGDHADLRAARGQRRQRLDPIVAGHEVGRDQQRTVPRAAQLVAETADQPAAAIVIAVLHRRIGSDAHVGAPVQRFRAGPLQCA